MKKPTLLLLTFALLLLPACAGAPAKKSTSGQSPAAQTLESYLKALSEKDENRLTQLVCADWEAQALLEYDSFGAVKTSLEGLSCQNSGSDGDATLVTCEGKILASYSNEVQEFHLGQREYRLVKNGSDWQVCGYTTR